MRIHIQHRQRRRSKQRSFLAGIAVVLFTGVFLLYGSPVSAAEELSFTERISVTFTGILRQIEGVGSYAAQAIDAVFDNSVRVGERQDPIEGLDLTIPDPLPVTTTRFPLQGAGLGTLIINAPLSITSTLTATGETTLATTTVAGLLTAQELALETLTVSGLVSAGSYSGGALTISGNAQVGSLDVTSAARFADISVAGEAEIGSVRVNGSGLFGSLIVEGATQLSGVLEAGGGIQTNGANVNLGAGSVFAANIVNRVVAGDGITVTGSSSEPIISVDLADAAVTSINGETGEVDFVAGDDISISSSLRISNDSSLSSVRGRGGCSGCIDDVDVANILTLTGGSIDGVAIGSTSASTAAFTETYIGTSTATTTLFQVFGSGTSNFGGSINLDSGCFSIGGVCVASAASSTSYVGLFDTPSTLIAGAIQYASTTGTELTQSSNFVFSGSVLTVGNSATTTGGIITYGSLSASSSVTFGDTLSVTGTTTVAALSAAGDVSVTGSLLVSASTTISDTLTVTGFTALNADLTVSGTSTIGGGLTVTGPATLGGSLTVDGAIAAENGAAFLMYDADNSNYVGLVASSTVTTDTVWTLPAQDGFTDQVLITDGAGNLSFASLSAIGGGINQYVALLDTPSSFASGTIPFANASGTALEHSADLRFDGTNLSIGPAEPSATLTVDGSVNFVASDGNIDFVYDDVSKELGLGTDSPTEKFTLIGGSFFQQGGTAANQYVPNYLGNTNLGDDIRDIEIAGGYAYLVKDTSGDEFYIFDISDSANPTQVSSTPLPRRGNDIEIAGRYAYIATGFSGADDEFFVFDVIDPANPVQIDSIDLVGAANDIALAGQYAYVVSDGGSNQFQVVDISDPFNVQVATSTSLSTNVRGVAVFGDYAYVVTEIAGDDFYSYDISDPLNPVQLDSVNLTDTATEIVISPSGNLAYVGTNGANEDLHVINTSNPSSLSISNQINLDAGVLGLYLSGTNLYATTYTTGDDFHVLDVSTPSSPVLIGEVDIGSGDVYTVAIVGQYAYTGSTAGLGIINISGAQMQSVLTNSFEAGEMFVRGGSNFASDVSVSGALYAGSSLQSVGFLQVNGTEPSYIAGALSVGTTSTSTALTVDGTMQATNLLGGATNLTTDASGNIIRDPSDARLKTNVTTIEGALDTLLELRGVRYNWIDTERFGPQAEIGFIAQEVDLILPEVVRKGGDYWSINTRNILAVVVEAVKELWGEVQGTQADVDELKVRLGELESQLSSSSVPVADSELEPEESASEEENNEAEETESSENDDQATESESGESTNIASSTEQTPGQDQSATSTDQTTENQEPEVLEDDSTQASSTEEVIEGAQESTSEQAPEDTNEVESTPAEETPEETTESVEVSEEMPETIEEPQEPSEPAAKEEVTLES